MPPELVSDDVAGNTDLRHISSDRTVTVPLSSFPTELPERFGHEKRDYLHP